MQELRACFASILAGVHFSCQAVSLNAEGVSILEEQMNRKIGAICHIVFLVIPISNMDHKPFEESFN